MQDETASSKSPPLLVPAFLFGDRTTCQRKMKAEAKKWVQRYREQGTFPEPKLVPMAPGSIAFTDESTSHFLGGGYSFMDLTTVSINPDDARQQGLHIQWRWYMLDNLRSEALWILRHDYEAYEAFPRAFETFACRYPSGALVVAITHALYNTIEAVSRRVEAVLGFWDLLDTVKYIDVFKRHPTLSEVMALHFEGHVAMWVDQPSGNIRTDLRTAIDQMRRASDDEIRVRLIKRLRELADTERDLKHRAWLKSPGVIEAGLVADENQERALYENLTTGHNGILGGFLYHLEKNYPGA
jgi:hypothetical protein